MTVLEAGCFYSNKMLYIGMCIPTSEVTGDIRHGNLCLVHILYIVDITMVISQVQLVTFTTVTGVELVPTHPKKGYHGYHGWHRAGGSTEIRGNGSTEHGEVIDGRGLASVAVTSGRCHGCEVNKPRQLVWW